MFNVHTSLCACPVWFGAEREAFVVTVLQHVFFLRFAHFDEELQSDDTSNKTCAKFLDNSCLEIADIQ